VVKGTGGKVGEAALPMIAEIFQKRKSLAYGNVIVIPVLFTSRKSKPFAI
jgi:cell division GTPase FtsZ